MRRTMPQETIDLVKSFGFKVYMRHRNDSWCIYSDGANIAYLEYDPMAGFTVSTVHMPSRQIGTGFQQYRHVSELTESMLRDGFQTLPAWARSFKTAPVKYRDIDHYRSSALFAAEYVEV